MKRNSLRWQAPVLALATLAVVTCGGEETPPAPSPAVSLSVFPSTIPADAISVAIVSAKVTNLDLPPNATAKFNTNAGVWENQRKEIRVPIINSSAEAQFQVGREPGFGIVQVEIEGNDLRQQANINLAAADNRYYSDPNGLLPGQTKAAGDDDDDAAATGTDQAAGDDDEAAAEGQ